MRKLGTCTRYINAASGVAALLILLGAVADSSTYNVPGQKRTHNCAVMKKTLVPIRFPDGSTTGFYVHADDPSQQGGASTPCAVGAMETDAQETLKDGNGNSYYFHPGGGPTYYTDYVNNGQYGHIISPDITPPAVAPQNLNGKAAPLAPAYVFAITPTRIPQDMWYKANVVNGSSGSTYYTYGNPGYDKTGGRGDWTYICWSVVQNGSGQPYPNNVTHGGGLVRALGKRDAVFNRCDVTPIVGISYGDGDVQNGVVTSIYGKTTAGTNGSPIYGWLVFSYQRIGEPLVPCVRRYP